MTNVTVAKVICVNCGREKRITFPNSGDMCKFFEDCVISIGWTFSINGDAVCPKCAKESK